MLYGGNGAGFEFGIHWDAVIPFLGDRSKEARREIRAITLEVWLDDIMSVDERLQALWVETMEYVRRELTGLSELKVIALRNDCGGMQDEKEATPQQVALDELHIAGHTLASLYESLTHNELAALLNVQAKLDEKHRKEQEAISVFVKSGGFKKAELSWFQEL